MTTLRRIRDAFRSALHRRAGLLRVLALVGAGLLVTAAVPNPAAACGVSDPASCVALIFVKIFQLLTALMGWVLVLEIDALIRATQYSNFVTPGPSAVQIGWVVTRDLANMMFIVVLLVLAFSTIIGKPAEYHYEKHLPRLLIMAVVINFTKTITGIFIDMGQVVMLTFVNGFKEAAAGNFVNAFQIGKLLELAEGQSSYDFGLVIAMMFAFILAAISACIVLVMLVMMIQRIVALWILIIMAPLAFMTSALPMKVGSYYADWWAQLKKHVMSGPIVAFFLWLALASVQDASSLTCTTPSGVSQPCGLSDQGFPSSSSAAQGEATAAGTIQGSQIPSAAGRADTIMNMIIAIAIMMFGLDYASKSGGVAGGLAKDIRGRLEKYGRRAASGTLGAATFLPRAAGSRAQEFALKRGGAALSKVPLLGGYGIKMAAQGEGMEKKRLAEREKFFGSPEDMARLSPGRFMSNLQNMHRRSPKEYEKWMKTGLANGETAKRMERDGVGKSALNLMVRNTKGKDFQNTVDLMMSDKRATAWAKEKDPETGKPDILLATRAKLKAAADAVGADPALKKKLEGFDQKFMVPLAKEKILGDDDLKKMSPKLAGDDLTGLDKEGTELMAKHLSGRQIGQYLQQEGKADEKLAMLDGLAKMDGGLAKALSEKAPAPGDIPSSWYKEAAVSDYVLDRTRNDAKARADAVGKGGESLATRADGRLAEALASGDSAKIVAALPDAISVGKLTASDIRTDAKLQAAIRDNAGQIDLNAIGRNVPVTDADRSEAGKAVASLINDVNPDKVRNARKNGMSDHILPTTAEVAARSEQARSAQTSSLGAEAPAAVADLTRQIAALQASSAAAPSATTTEEIKRLTGSMESIQAAISRREEAETSLDDMRERIGFANSGQLPMPTAELEALKRAANGFEERLRQLDEAVAKAVADVKGVKYDVGAQQRKNNRVNRANDRR